VADLLSDLNTPQREAVTHGEGPLLILAGAGSGKTRALTYRIAYLIYERGVAPWSILAITFTNKAAGEMKARVAALVPDLAERIWVATFHSTCAKILRREAPVAERSRDFAIYDDADQLAVLRRILSGLRWDQQRFPPQAFRHMIGSAKNELLGPEEYYRWAAERRGDFWADRTAQVYRAYERELVTNNAFDFDDLVGKTVELFESRPDVLARYQDRFEYILVDEYQDTNHAQYRLVNALASRHRNLSVVGDDDQSIYTFRGADPRNILEFERDYPDAKVIKLEQNYRSTVTVLQAANSVVSHNERRKHKELWTENAVGERLGFYQAMSQRDEAQFVCRTVLELREREGLRLGECAVLYRTNAQSRPVEEVLIDAGVPYQIVGGLRFFERKEIKDATCYLRLVLNPADTVSLERVVNVPRRGVGKVTWERILAEAAGRGMPAGEALATAGEWAGVPGRTREELVGLGELISELHGAVDRLPPQDLVQAVLERSGYLAELRAEGTDEAAARIENLEELYRQALEHAEYGEEPGLGGFMERVALVSDIDEFEGQTDKVVLMTVHSAKGLEFETVFLIGLDDGVFPHQRSLSEPDGLEEERRLCYVAMTRAMSRLYLSSMGRRAGYGGQAEPVAPSRFLREIPANLLRVIPGASGWTGDVTRRGGRRRAAATWSRGQAAGGQGQAPGGPQAGSQTGLPPKRRLKADEVPAAGEKVRHPKFGRGTVVAVKGAGGDAEITVWFPDLGMKRLLAGYARLERERGEAAAAQRDPGEGEGEGEV